MRPRSNDTIGAPQRQFSDKVVLGSGMAGKIQQGWGKRKMQHSSLMCSVYIEATLSRSNTLGYGLYMCCLTGGWSAVWKTTRAVVACVSVGGLCTLFQSNLLPPAAFEERAVATVSHNRNDVSCTCLSCSCCCSVVWVLQCCECETCRSRISTEQGRRETIDSTRQSIRTHQIPSTRGSDPKYRLQSAEERITVCSYRTSGDWCADLAQYIFPFAIQRMVSNCGPWIRGDICLEGDMGEPVLRGIGVGVHSRESGEYGR
jgi:hypothetical protein